MKPPKTIWILVDVSNGGCGVERNHRNYLWWFHTRTAARRHKAQQSREPYGARLEGPFKYYQLYSR